jgi:hypothetical protein
MRDGMSKPANGAIGQNATSRTSRLPEVETLVGMAVGIVLMIIVGRTRIRA